MFAVRRSLRVASRSFTSLGKTTLAKAVVAAPFSVQPTRHDATSLNLDKVLRSEIKAGEEDNEEFMGEYVELKTDILKKWDMTVNSEKAEVTLTRTSKNDKISVIYNVQDYSDFQEQEGEEGDEEEEEQERDDEEEEDQSPKGLNFEVRVENERGVISFHCAGSLKGIVIQHIGYVKEAEQLNNERGYLGPDFDTLEPELLDKFYYYLEELGIGEELCIFMMSNSEEVENKLYVQWLKNIHSVIVGK